MAVTHTTAVRNGIADYVVDLVDGGATAGLLIFRITGSTAATPTTEVATLTFTDPAFGAASSGTATASAITDDSSATGGTVAFATLEDDVSTVCAHCNVTATGGGGDIELSSLVVAATDTVSMSSLTYSAPS